MTQTTTIINSALLIASTLYTFYGILASELRIRAKSCSFVQASTGPYLRGRGYEFNPPPREIMTKFFLDQSFSTVSLFIVIPKTNDDEQR